MRHRYRDLGAADDLLHPRPRHLRNDALATQHVRSSGRGHSIEGANVYTLGAQGTRDSALGTKHRLAELTDCELPQGVSILDRAVLGWNMGFELIIATKRDPDETHEPRAMPRAKPYTAIDVVGVFDDAASSAVLQSVSESHEDGAGSVIVTLNETLDEDTTCLRTFGERIMSLRAAGIEVQVSTSDRHTHSQLGNLADSRDWLLRYSNPASSGPRRAIHLERPTTE